MGVQWGTLRLGMSHYTHCGAAGQDCPLWQLYQSSVSTFQHSPTPCLAMTWSTMPVSTPIKYSVTSRGGGTQQDQTDLQLRMAGIFRLIWILLHLQSVPLHYCGFEQIFLELLPRLKTECKMVRYLCWLTRLSGHHILSSSGALHLAAKLFDFWPREQF